MKKIVLSAAAALAIMAGCGSPKEFTDFTITASIPGLKPGDKVTLRPSERDFGVKIDTVAGDGVFVIKGEANQPFLASIDIEPAGSDGMGKAFPLMVENGIITVEAAHVDSLPPSWYTGTEGKLKERNLTIKGGRAQSEFAEFQEFMLPYELDIKKHHQKSYWGSKASREEKAAAQVELEKAQGVAEAKEAEFVNAHPGYSISALKIGEQVSKPFKYTDDELTDIAGRLMDCPDTARVAMIHNTIKNARKHTRGSRYTDFELTAPDGNKKLFSSHFGNGKVKFVDMWASWCSPCRAAIPHVKELHAKYPESLEVISLSVDQDDKAWRKAMDDEKMPWVQFIAKDGTPDILRESYRLSAIPYLLVFSDEGNILYAGSNPREVSELLAELIK